MSKILVTGGSGFIGTNLVEYFSLKGHNVLNYDIKKPKNEIYLKNWIQGDILDEINLKQCFENFNPEYVVHLAARTDLNENRSLKGYAANIEGVENVVNLINSSVSVKRVIYASSRMVCKIDYIPKDFNDFCPPNLYGESKMIGEKFVKDFAKHDFVVVRPTSIWGPYFEIPYRTFFETVRKKMFFLPKGHNPNKSFGFVLNTTYQLEKLLFASANSLNECYYLTDYPELKVKQWANMISYEFGNGKTISIPMIPLRIVSKIGDFLYKVGWKNPPLTSFRLNNLISNMVYDTTDLQKACGDLPYTLEEGVKITASWMKKN